MNAPLACHVLLVEDNLADAELVADQLSGQPVRLEHVELLDDALTRLNDARYDAVLLDLGLPDSKGLDGVKRVLDVDQSVAVVVLTGLNDDEMGSAAVRLGAQDFVVKGSTVSAGLMKVLRYAVERARWQRQLFALVSRNADAMVVVDAESAAVQHVNKAAVELFAPGLSVGQPFPFSLEDRSTAVVEIPSGEGEVRHAQMRVADIEWGRKPAYLVSLRDITDLRRARELEQRMLHADRLASIGQLAAGVAHEINNPSMFVQNNLEAMEETIAELRSGCSDAAGALLDALHEMVAESLAGAKRISSIVRDLSTFSRIDSDDIARVDINDLVGVAVNMAQHEIRHRARLELSLAEGLPKLSLDSARIIQVVLNLLINAAQAIPPGDRASNRICVETRMREGMVELSVTDTGCGMSEMQLRRIFEPFYTTKPRGVGTGLGLPISAESVRRHRGELGATSELGQGSCFRISLPLNTGLTSSAPPRVEAEPIESRAARVLVIDDEPMVRRSLRRVLEPQHHVVEASSGEEALELVRLGTHFDVVVCDLMMPGADGIDVHAALADERPELLRRMLFLTGGVFTPRAKDFLARSKPLVFEKPIDASTLRSLVRSLAQRIGS